MNFWSDPRTVFFSSPIIKMGENSYRHVTYLMPKSLCDEVGNPRCFACSSLDVSQAYDTATDTLEFVCRSCGRKEHWYNANYYGWVQLCQCGAKPVKLVYNEYDATLVHVCECGKMHGHKYTNQGWLGCFVPESARNWTQCSKEE